jgi:hypothetical protein
MVIIIWLVWHVVGPFWRLMQLVFKVKRRQIVRFLDKWTGGRIGPGTGDDHHVLRGAYGPGTGEDQFGNRPRPILKLRERVSAFEGEELTECTYYDHYSGMKKNRILWTYHMGKNRQYRAASHLIHEQDKRILQQRKEKEEEAEREKEEEKEEQLKEKKDERKQELKHEIHERHHKEHVEKKKEEKRKLKHESETDDDKKNHQEHESKMSELESKIAKKEAAIAQKEADGLRRRTPKQGGMVSGESSEK